MDKATKKENNLHHLIPKSRGGGSDNNIVELPRYWHDAWHRLFENLTVDEAHKMIDIVMRANKTWTRHELNELIKHLRREK